MFEQILPNLFAFYSPNEGSNSYLLVGKMKILVDSGLKKNAELLKDSLKAVGLNTGEIDMVLHTHGHADHFSADCIFPNAEILMNKSDAEKVNIKDSMFSASALFGTDYYPKIKSYLEGGREIKAEPFNLKVIETPGHTKGGVCFYDKKKKLLFSGDTLFNGSVGRYDLLGSSKYDLIRSITELSRLDFEILLPGHGLILKGRQKENIRNALGLLK